MRNKDADSDREEEREEKVDQVWEKVEDKRWEGKRTKKSFEKILRGLLLEVEIIRCGNIAVYKF